jgi:hypothetical protein
VESFGARPHRYPAPHIDSRDKMVVGYGCASGNRAVRGEIWAAPGGAALFVTADEPDALSCRRRVCLSRLQQTILARICGAVVVLWLGGTAEQNSPSWCAASRLLRPISRRFDGIAAATFDADRAHALVARSSPPRRKALSPPAFVAARSASSTRPHPDARPGTQRVRQAQGCVPHLAFDAGNNIVIPHRRDWRRWHSAQ